MEDGSANSTNTPLSVHVKITVDPANSEAFLTVLRPLFEKVTAEPLNVFCEVYRDEKNPGVFRIVENWNASLDHMMNVSIESELHPSDSREGKIIIRWSQTRSHVNVLAECRSR
jgi:hypothetical protein